MEQNNIGTKEDHVSIIEWIFQASIRSLNRYHVHQATKIQQLAALREEVLCVIFLDLHKAYEALDRSRCLEILEGYGVSPRACCILCKYWRQLTMVARAGGYYGASFKGDQEVTQGDLISPTIFNAVVDAVVRHWVTVMLEGAEERGKCGQEGRHHNALFYADDGMVALLEPQWLQGTFSTLVVMFDRVGLRTNLGKTVGMVCHLCQAAGNQLEAAHRRRITGEGPSYLER